MKLKRFVATVLALVATLALISCGESGQDEYEGKAKVLFNLEGGTYKNSSEALAHYYSVDGGPTLIIAPETIDPRVHPIEKSGYVIEGWYKVKDGDGETATYSEKWDFAYDKVGAEGVTLYAKWKKDIDFTYTLCYRNEDGELVKITDDSVYSVDAGEKFKDLFDYSLERDGYTFLGKYETEDGTPWDGNFVHPGDEANPNVNVVAVYLPIKGDFNIVSNAKEFISAAEGTKDIYLTADIDLGGAEFKFKNLKNKQLIGNGHTVSNFSLKCDIGKDTLEQSPDGDASSPANSIRVSLLGDLENSTVIGVNFENVTVSLDYKYPEFVKNLYFAPIAVTVKNSTVKDVSVSCTVTYGAHSFDSLESAHITVDKGFYKEIGENVIENVTLNAEIAVDGE